jgi:outer membrane murein-binding lipoprotein Lpp
MQKDHLEVILENIDSKFDLVLEGHDTLNRKIDNLAHKTDERFDLLDLKIEALNQKMDKVATDLKAHREDAESHQGVYRVKEG